LPPSTKRLARLLPASASFSASELIDDQVRVARKANPNVDIIQADVYDMPHADRSFDLIFLLEVLEHTPDPELALRNIRRLVAPGGWLIVGVPREPIWRILNLVRGKYLSTLGNTPGHIQHWGSGAFVSMIEGTFGRLHRQERPLPWTIVAAQRCD